MFKTIIKANQTVIRPLKNKKHKQVLLALGYYDQHLHQGVANYARQAGWLLDTSMAHHGQIPPDWNGDGIITLLFPHQKELLAYIKKADVPTVSLNTDEVPLFSGVRLNHEQAGIMAAEYLSKQNVDTLYFFKCSDISDIRGRIIGFEKAASAAGLPCGVIDWHRRQHHTAGSHESMFLWLVEQLKHISLPAGILAQSDKRASVLLAACEEAGLEVAKDVQILGVDNDELTCQSCRPPLSSLDTNRIRLAWEGALLLDRLMSGADVPPSPLLIDPLGVVIRQSSGHQAVTDPVIAEAIRFIEEHFCKSITAESVAGAVPMSRCSFYAAFKTCTGQSPAQIILRRRIQKACRLLVHSNEKLYAIAQQCGFSCHEHFTRAFTRACGQTPSDYRRMHTIDLAEQAGL